MSDGTRKDDKSFHIDGIVFVIDGDTLARFSPIRVDYDESSTEGRFRVTSPHLEMVF